MLREFSLRRGSGGRGLHPGGDGVIREIEFLRPMTCGILSERRAFQPYGMNGGQPAQTGKNIMIVRELKGAGEEDFQLKDEDEKPTSAKKGRSSKKSTAASSSSSSSSSSGPVEYVFREVNLGGKNTYKAKPHDRIRIMTPGGGGYGTPSTTDDVPMVDTVESSSSSSSVSHKRKAEGDDGTQLQVVKKQSLEVTLELRARGSVAAWTTTAEQA